MKKTWCLLFLSVCCLSGADKRPIFTSGPKPVGPYTPGIVAGDFLYVSGQGARSADNKISPVFEEQVRQTLENVKTIVEAAGLTMEHVVYTQLYLVDTSKYDEMNKIWTQYFKKDPPARATVGVYRMPVDTPVEVTAVAVMNLSKKKVILPPGYPANAPVSPGVMAGERLYLSGFLGRNINTGQIPENLGAQVQLALDRMKATLAAAGMDFRHMVFINPYLTEKMPMGIMNKIYAQHFEFGNTPARATIKVHSLPSGANIEFTGVAIRDLAKRVAVRPKNMPPSPTASPCVFADETLFCSAKSAFIPGPMSGIYFEDVETQVRMSMRNLLDGLEEAGMDFSHVVATNVYLDNMDEFSKMNGTYAKYFRTLPPTRTTVSPEAPVERKKSESGAWPKIEEISLIAVK